MNQIFKYKKFIFVILIIFFTLGILMSFYLYFHRTQYLLYVNQKHHIRIGNINHELYSLMHNSDTIYKITIKKADFLDNPRIYYYYSSGDCEFDYIDTKNTILVSEYVHKYGINLQVLGLILGIFSLFGFIFCFKSIKQK